MPIRPQILAAAVLASLAALSAPLATAQSVRGEPLRLENAKRAEAVGFKAAAIAPAATLRFQSLDNARVAAMQRHNAANGRKRLQIGIERRVADEADTLLPASLDWTPVAGGKVLRFDVASPDAAALRVGLDLRGLPDGAELRVASATGGVVEFADAAAMKAGVDGNGIYWSPVTDGAAQRLELFVPNGAAEFSPVVSAASHLVTSPFRPLSLAKALGDSEACNIDVACRTTTLGQPFVNAKNAVARMVYQDNGSFTCTGTLLNDSTPATQVPYFYSAAHCFNSQAAASTLTTFWNYETPTCGVSDPGANTQLTGGADLLFGNNDSDALFLRLRTTPPAGAFFSGWDASTIGANSAVIAIHHPSGDNKKYSRGVSPGFSSLTVGAAPGSFIRANWQEGTTEGGSSGSGLFTLTGGQYVLRGGLFGGTASCANSNGPDVNQGNRDFYSRFDQVYPSLQQWLGTAATVGPTRDYTGAWFVPTESGWGLTVFNFPGQMFALFFVYDSQGRPTWYRFQGPWTGSDVVTAPLDRAASAAWSANFNPGGVSYTNVGTGTMTFTSATSATLTFNDGTVNRTVTLSKI